MAVRLPAALRANPWLGLASSVALCTALAGGVSVLRSPVYQAAARIEVQPDPISANSAGNAASERQKEVSTQIQVLKSDRVLEIAAKKLGIGTVQPLDRAVRPSPVGSTRVIEISASRPTGREAALWANAVADAYVEFRRALLVSNSAAAGQLITGAVDRVKDQIATLDAQLKENPPNAQAIRAQRQQLTSQLSALQGQLSALPQVEAVRRGGATIISAAQPPSRPSRPRPLREAGLGAALGALLGTPFVLAEARRRRYRRLVQGELPKEEIDSGQNEPYGRSSSESASRALEPARDMQDALGARIDERLEQIASELVTGMGSLQSEQQEATRLLHSLNERAPAQTDHSSIPGPQFEEAVRRLTAAIEDQQQKTEQLLGLQSGHHLRAIEKTQQNLADQLGARIDSVLGGVETAKATLMDHGSKGLTGLEQRLEHTVTQMLEVLRAQADQLGARIDSVLGGVETAKATLLDHGSKRLTGLEQRLEHTVTQMLEVLRAQQKETTELLRSMSPQDALEAKVETVLKRFGQVLAGQVGALTTALARSESGVDQKLQQHRDAFLQVLHEVESGSSGRISELGNYLSSLVRATKGEARSQSEALLDIRQALERVLGAHSALAGVAQSNNEVLERLAPSLGQLQQGLERLETELKTGLAGRQGEITGAVESFQQRLEGQTDTLAALSDHFGRLREGLRVLGERMPEATQSAGRELVERVREDLSSLHARIAEATHGVGTELMEKVQVTEGELHQRMNLVDARVSQRLGQVAIKLTQALDSIRSNFSESLVAHHNTMVSLLETLQAQRDDAYSDGRRRLSRIADDIGREIERLEGRFQGVMEDITTSTLEGVRQERRGLARTLEEIRDRALEASELGRSQDVYRIAQLERMLAEKSRTLSAEFTERLEALQVRLWDELASQQDALAGILATLEGKVDRQGAEVAKRLSSRLKSLEQSLTSGSPAANRAGARGPKTRSQAAAAEAASQKAKVIRMPGKKSQTQTKSALRSPSRPPALGGDEGNPGGLNT